MEGSLETLLKLNEFIDIKDFIEEQVTKEAEEKATPTGRRH